jgi:hypothetical protein
MEAWLQQHFFICINYFMKHFAVHDIHRLYLHIIHTILERWRCPTVGLLKSVRVEWQGIHFILKKVHLGTHFLHRCDFRTLGHRTTAIVSPASHSVRTSHTLTLEICKQKGRFFVAALKKKHLPLWSWSISKRHLSIQSVPRKRTLQHYVDKLVKPVYRNNSCLQWKSYKTHKFQMGS